MASEEYSDQDSGNNYGMKATCSSLYSTSIHTIEQKTNPLTPPPPRRIVYSPTLVVVVGVAVSSTAIAGAGTVAAPTTTALVGGGGCASPLPRGLLFLLCGSTRPFAHRPHNLWNNRSFSMDVSCRTRKMSSALRRRAVAKAASNSASLA